MPLLIVFRDIKFSIGAQLSNFRMQIYLIKSSLIYGDQLSKIRNELIATHFKRLNYIETLIYLKKESDRIEQLNSYKIYEID